MSTISDAYDKIINQMNSSFPNHTRISNPYELAENNRLFLTQGFGVALGEATNVQQYTGTKMRIQRTVNIALTLKFYAREMDATSKADTEKTLLEDHFTLIDDFRSNNNLNGTVADFEYQSDGGIESVFAEQDQFLAVVSQYQLDYIENLN